MPKTTAGAILTKKENGIIKILLTKRTVEPFKDYWCIPGGHIEDYEDAETAVKREVKEETNLDFSPVFLTYLDEIFEDKRVHNVVLLFFGEASGILKTSADEVSEADWFEIKDIRNKILAFEHNRAVDLFVKLIMHK